MLLLFAWPRNPIGWLVRFFIYPDRWKLFGTKSGLWDGWAKTFQYNVCRQFTVCSDTCRRALSWRRMDAVWEETRAFNFDLLFKLRKCCTVGIWIDGSPTVKEIYKENSFSVPKDGDHDLPCCRCCLEFSFVGKVTSSTSCMHASVPKCSESKIYHV